MAGGEADSRQIKHQVEHGAQPETRATRRVRRYENAVKRRPRGADISDLQGPVRPRGRGASKQKGADGRVSRSRSPSPAGKAEDHGGKSPARPHARPEARSAPGAMVAMGVRTIGGPQARTAAALYREAASDPDESLFDGVDLQQVGSGPGTSASGAIGGSGGAELAAAAAASLAVAPGVDVEPMDE